MAGSPLYWLDFVWFDTKIPKDIIKEWNDNLPIVGFEIEDRFSVTSIKATIENFEALRPALGCIVIPQKVADRKVYGPKELHYA